VVKAPRFTYVAQLVDRLFFASC